MRRRRAHPVNVSVERDGSVACGFDVLEQVARLSEQLRAPRQPFVGGICRRAAGGDKRRGSQPRGSFWERSWCKLQQEGIVVAEARQRARAEVDGASNAADDNGFEKTADGDAVDKITVARAVRAAPQVAAAGTGSAPRKCLRDRRPARSTGPRRGRCCPKSTRPSTDCPPHQSSRPVRILPDHNRTLATIRGHPRRRAWRRSTRSARLVPTAAGRRSRAPCRDLHPP